MPFVGKNNLTAKERLYGEAIINQTRREREKAQQEAEEKARRWASLQMDNADKGPMPSPREMISLGGQALTSGTVQTAADAIQRMRQQMLEQEQQRKEEERRRAMYQPKPEQTAKDLAGMRLDAGDFAKVGGQALTSGTVQSAAKSLGSYKQSKQPSGPVKVDFMGTSSERDARLELLNENLRRLEDQRKMQEAKAAPNQEERQAQQEAFWRDRALSTGYSPNSSVQMSTRQQEAAEKAGALKNQERELGQYIKYLEGQGVQDRAQNAVTERDVQRGLNSTIEKGDITTGNEKVRSLARAIQYGKLGLEPHGFNDTDISANMKWADALTERQKDTILAFAGREDWDGAQRYLNSISDQLNQKVAESEYNDLGTAGKALYWAPAGIDQFASGIAQLGNSEARNQTVTNRVSQMVQQDAYDTHPGLGFLYDMGTSISNMTPSILLSAVAGPALGAAGLSASTAGAVAGGIGSAALGASAGGNAYAEKRRQGYSEDEAAAYATMVGASEAGLQYVLGGISKLGATPLAKAAEMVSKIDNAFGQAAIKLGANMLSEGVEEGLQSVLEPAFATLILDEKYQVSPQEVVTSFLMGALTAGLLEGMGAVRVGRAGQEVARNGGFDATAVDGYMGESGVDYFRGVSNLEEASQGLDILDDYYGLSRGQNEDVRADVERQYAMRSAWYEGRDQARRATEQTATEETQQDNVGQEWTQVDNVGQEWTQVDTNGQNGTPDTQAAEPEGLRLGAMWEDTQGQTAQGTPQEPAGADQTARLVQEARETVQAARAAQEAQNQEGQFQRMQPVNTAQPEGLTLGAMWADNEASNPQNLNEGAGVNGRKEDAAPAAGAATPTGRDLLDGGQGRVYGQGPGQQAGVVEEGPAGAAQTSEQGRAASARHDLAKNLRGQEVSSRQLGLSRGTDTANVLVMPQELWDTEMVQVAQEVQARTGATVTYVLGNMEVSNTDGSVGTVRGVQMPGRIIVRADHPRVSVEQIAKHEEFHVYAGRNTNMVRDAENRIMAKYDQAEFQAVVNTYIENLRGIIDIPPNGTNEQVVEAYYKILEEIYADAYAGINAFGVETSRYQETVREVAQEREAIRASRENAKATERTTGPTDTAKENGAGVRDGGLEEAENAEQSSEEDAKKQEVYRQAKEMRDALRDAYAEGRISEAEYDAAMDVVLERVDVDGGSMLEMWDRWDREDGMERYSAEDEETLNEFAIGDDGNIYLPGQPMPEAVKQQRAKDTTKSQARQTEEKFSVEDEETLTEFAIGDDGNIYLPGQPMPEAVKRMRAAQQKDASVDRKQLEPDQREAYSTEDAKDSIVDTLPRKAQNYLSRAERAMVRKLGDLLSVPTAAQREYLQETVREISEEYLKEGRISQESMDRLFENAYDQGVVVKEGLMDEYRDLYNRLRNTELVFSKEYHGDIADFEAFRRKYQNRLRIKTKGRTNIDQVYMELAEDWPGFFNNEEHTHPSDQLEHIAKVMDGFQKVEMSLDAYYGGDEDFKRWAKHDFEVAVTDMLGGLRNVKRYADEQAAAQTARQEAIPTTQAEVEESWRKVKEARKKYEKVNAKSLLTNDDKVAVGQLLRGEIKLEHLDPDKLNVKDIRAVYQAKEEYERLAKGIKAWNRSRKEQAKAEADTFLETANDWKDKPAGILYSRETMERNIRDIIKDKELAQRIIDTYFTPVHKGAAAATRMKNTYRERVRSLELSRKVEKGNVVSEAHAVQLLGEAEDNIRVLEQMKGQDKKRDGKTLEEWRSVVAELWEQNPNLNEGKIRNAIKEFRAIYDDLFQQMNEVRVRNGYEPVNYRQGYFPHFQPGNEEGILAAFGRAMGISTEVTALPTTINGLTHTFRPGIRWFGNAQERLGFNTAYDAVEGFDRYIEGVADVIHQTDNIQRLRALASQIRYRTGDEGIRRQVDAVRDNTTLAEQDKESRIEKIYKNGRFALSNFVVELDEYTNLLANKKSRADRNMEQNFGRNKFYNFMKWVEKRVAANMVAINPGSWLTNFIPLTQGRASLDRWMLLRGMWDTLRAYKGDGGFVDTSTFLTNRRGSDPIVKSWSQSASAVLSKPMEFIDQFTADSLVRARYRQNVKRGMSEAAAMDDADAWAAGVMADRSKGSMPTLFEHKNPLAKMFTQFQLEVNNQLSYVFKDVPREVKEKGLLALAVALLKFAVGAFLYNEVYEFIVGRRPALDPIGMLNDTVGDLTGWELPNLVELGVDATSGDLTAEDFQTDRGKLYDAAEGLAGNVAENLPFISGFLGGGRYPVMNALPDFQNAARAALDSDWNTEKKLYELSSGFENPLTYLLLPFGGGQLKKIYNGVKAAVQGGKYSVNSDGEEILQYPMFMDSRGESIANVTRAILFGTTSLPTGQEWVEEGFKSLTAEQTVAYKWMMEEGVTGREAFYLIKELRSATKTDDQSKAQVQRDILEKAGLNDGALEAAYYTMVATNKEREIIDAMEEAGADTGVVTRALMELKQADATTQAAVERVLKSVQGLTNAERRKLWQLQNTGWDEKKNPF